LLNPESRELSVAQTQFLLVLCKRLGWIVNEKKSDLTSSQVATYLGMTFDTRTGFAYPASKRIDRWLSIAKEFIDSQAQPAQLWARVLGHLASLEKLVPYGRAIWLGLMAFQDSILDSNVAILGDNVSAICCSEESGGDSVSVPVSVSQPSLLVGRGSVHNIDTQTSSWASECFSRSAEQEGPGPEDRMESKSSRSEACVQTLGQSPSGSLRSQAKFQASDFLFLSIDFLLELPPTLKLLKQTFTNLFHPRPQSLNLHVWRFSVDSTELEAFRNKCPNGSLFL